MFLKYCLYCLGGLLLTVLPAHSAALAREPNTTLRMPLNPVFGGYELVNAYGPLLFSNPVSIESPPGETNRLFIAERAGPIVVITNLTSPNRTTYLDLTAVTGRHNIESGLLGLTFHPGFATNGFFYVFRTAFLEKQGFHNIVSRFRQSESDPSAADPASETVILSVPDPSEEHNAGDIQFGPDGYLYVPMGDLGGLIHVVQNPQAIDESLFGGILRIDVDDRPGSLSPNPLPDATLNFRVPADNPFIGITEYQGRAVLPEKVRTEFFAVGFRNPWRITFDPASGDLVAGDVGGGLLEEINVVRQGRNYGWPYYEGPLPLFALPQDMPPDFPFAPSLVDYGHGTGVDQGFAVVGGIFYTGTAIPELAGNYLYADNISGNLWALPYNGQSAAPVRLTGETGISAFGRDPASREVLVANHETGSLKRLVYHPPSAANVPLTLAKTGVFRDPVTLAPEPGVVPYEINLSFWSDNALKQRFFSLPDTNLTFGFSAEGNWVFPPGTVWVKHFEMELTNGVPASRKRLETRLIVMLEDQVYGVTYHWDDSQTNAVLVPAEGAEETLLIHDGDSVREQTWRYPSRAECVRCHTRQAGFALGFNTPQLNCDAHYGDQRANQIISLGQAGYLNAPVNDTTSLRQLAGADDTAFPLEHRFRSYLAVNCSYCHQPESWSTLDAFWDGRLSTSLAETRLMTNYISPNSPENSRLFQRITHPYELMPPIATAFLNTNAINLVGQWIAGLPLAPWIRNDLGTPVLEGSSTLTQAGLAVSGAGLGFGGDSEQAHFLSQPVTGNVQVTARLLPSRPDSQPAVAGLMLRESLAPAAPCVALLRDTTGSTALYSRFTPGEPSTISAGDSFADAAWLKLVKEGTNVTGFASPNGVDWSPLDTVPLNGSGPLLAGLTSASGNPYRYATAEFDNVRVVSAQLSSPAGPTAFQLPTTVLLAANVTAGFEHIEKIEFLAGTNVLGTAFTTPYELRWTNGVSGSYEVCARVYDKNANAFLTSPATVTLTLPPARAVYSATDSSSQGNWQGGFGAQGYMIAGDSTNLSAGASMELERGALLGWESPSTDKRALRTADGQARVATAWSSPSELDLAINLADGLLHRVTLYCVDWDAQGRAQQIEVRDAVTEAVLDAQTVTNFANGVYLGWNLRGAIRFRVHAVGQGSAVVSGLFIDETTHRPATVALATSPDSTLFTAPTNIWLQARVSGGDALVQKAAFYANGQLLGEADSEPFSFLWSRPPARDYQLVVRVTDDLGETVQSPPLNLSVQLPAATALFLGADTFTQGDWLGAYGAQGFLLASDRQSLPDYLDLRRLEGRSFAWGSGDLESRALQRWDGSGRIAGCWVDDAAVTLDFAFLDGLPHILSCYILDWDSNLRRQNLNLQDLVSGAVLDIRDSGEFHSGAYFRWQVTGAASLRVERSTLGGNAVVSGFFLDSTNLPPRIRKLEVAQENGIAKCVLTWSALPDRTYRLEQFAPASGLGWQPLPGQFLADAPTATAVCEMQPATTPVYFRVQLLP